MSRAASDMRSSALAAAKRLAGLRDDGISVEIVTRVPLGDGLSVQVVVAIPTMGGIPSMVYASRRCGSHTVTVSISACCAICTRLAAPTPEVS